ncbi:MAG: ammonium transporter [Actinomycetota bacterium]
MKKTLRRGALVGGLSGLFVALIAGVASAQEAEPAYGGVDIAPGDLAVSLNLLWVVLGAVLVIFMQAGFALVETGFCRRKHAAHVFSTNFAIFGLGFVGFFLIGFPLAFGGFSYASFGMDAAVGDALIGSGNWVFLWQGGWALSDLGTAAQAAPIVAFFLYMVAFMDTTATIPTGAMAERWKWNAFVGWGLFCGAIFYPLFAAWTWGGGWLAKLGNSAELGFGYVDFAGSGVVHAVGGAAALAGALVLGPRIGKYGKDGKSNAMPGHNVPMAMLGVFILLVGWFGFNAASTFAATDVRFAMAAVNTALAAAFGATIAMFYAMQRLGKPDPGMMANGMLAGLVAITAPCAFVEPWAAAVIGSVAAVIVFEAIAFIEKRGIDDPVGAISVHGVCGIFGVLCIGIFSSGEYGAGWNATTEGAAATATGVTGVLYDFELGIRQLGSQAIGALTICTVIFGIAYGFFKLQNALMKGGIRPSREIELEGMDIPEMGALAYPDDELIMPSDDTVADKGGVGAGLDARV